MSKEIVKKSIVDYRMICQEMSEEMSERATDITEFTVMNDDSKPFS